MSDQSDNKLCRSGRACFFLQLCGKALCWDNENGTALLVFCRFFWYAGKGIGNRPAVKEMQHADNPALE
jgi:hypothetical protein